jgi:CBS domain-containing protein
VKTANTSGGMSALSLAQVGQIAPRVYGRCDVGDPVFKVVEEMKTKGRGAVVVEEGGKLVGIFTERDLLSRLDHEDALWQRAIVRDVMTPAPAVVRPEDSLADALRLLVSGKRRHLPVVDPHGKVTSLLSIRDILVFVAGKFPEEMINLPPNPDHET